jgi:DNA invertase Pin-like site-specific DNA recombinase
MLEYILESILTYGGFNMAKGQRIGYIRVSSVDQNTARQLVDVQLDRVFEDKVSGKDTHRPQLQAALAFCREGDVLIVHSMDRLARNLDDLRKIVLDLTTRGVHVQFVKESLTFTGEDSPMANLLLSVMGAFAQFERDLIRERQREGVQIAKAAGAYKGRKPSLTPDRVAVIRQRLAGGEQKAALARELKISRQTLDTHLKAGNRLQGGKPPQPQAVMAPDRIHAEG